MVIQCIINGLFIHIVYGLVSEVEGERIAYRQSVKVLLTDCIKLLLNFQAKCLYLIIFIYCNVAIMSNNHVRAYCLNI
jgi:hypothetical protein